MAFTSSPPMLVGAGQSDIVQWSAQFTAWLAAQDFGGGGGGGTAEPIPMGDWTLPAGAANQILQWNSPGAVQPVDVGGELHSDGAGQLWVDDSLRSGIRMFRLSVTFRDFGALNFYTATTALDLPGSGPTLVLGCWIKHGVIWATADRHDVDLYIGTLYPDNHDAIGWIYAGEAPAPDHYSYAQTAFKGSDETPAAPVLARSIDLAVSCTCAFWDTTGKIKDLVSGEADIILLAWQPEWIEGT